MNIFTEVIQDIRVAVSAVRQRREASHHYLWRATWSHGEVQDVEFVARSRKKMWEEADALAEGMGIANNIISSLGDTQRQLVSATLLSQTDGVLSEYAVDGTKVVHLSIQK